MLVLTLLALEGMARLAYYAAYGQGYGGGPAGTENAALPESTDLLVWRRVSTARDSVIQHPFYGYSNSLPGKAINAMPPRQRREDTVVIGLLGGSVAEEFEPYFQRALNRWFAANQLPRQPVVIGLADGGIKQPQQTLIVANTLLLGGEFDLIVNLDGFNEINGGAGINRGDIITPFFPIWWHHRVGLTTERFMLAGHIGVLRREQARLTAVGETPALGWSALFGMANRYRQEKTAAEIIRLNHELAAVESDYSLERHGPKSWPEGEAALLQESARSWYRGSLMLFRLAELAGAEYYHFLQPSQYLPGAKPLSPEELERAYVPDELYGYFAIRGYPLLLAFNRDLQGQGVNYFDLTRIFADHPETLYYDICCHLNARGNELLAAAMIRQLEPALRRQGYARPEPSVSSLAAARRAVEPLPPRNDLAFQVSLQDDGKSLRYVREGCATEDTEPLFFLHLAPRDLTDLPPSRREQGFDDLTLSFAGSGGSISQGQCVAQIPLPDYPLAALRTGQLIPLQGELWSADLIVPADPNQLRSDYSALAAAEPVARDYFDLYGLDNRLLYRRESCAAADTAAPFFLHIIPRDVTDLPAERRPAGFAHFGFDFVRRGGHFDGKCLAAISLPEYPIKEMRTGQHIPGQDNPLWSVQLIAAPDFDQLRADYAALSAVRPAVRDYFDLYWQDNRLLYLRETCAPADTAANFFLHIVPQEITDLPENRRDAGFAHGGFEFVRQGGHFDGKCLAVVPLPDYPIKKMRTGQHIPGQGDLWSAVIAAP